MELRVKGVPKLDNSKFINAEVILLKHFEMSSKYRQFTRVELHSVKPIFPFSCCSLKSRNTYLNHKN